MVCRRHLGADDVSFVRNAKMGRGRQLSSDDEGLTQDEAVKRVTTQPANQISTGHYVSPTFTAKQPNLSTSD